MRVRIAEAIRRYVEAHVPWTPAVGLARSMLAVATLLTLAFNESYILFRPGSGVPQYPVCYGLSRGSIFCLLSGSPERLELARWICVLILVIVATGWRPRITGVLHWWVAFSLYSAALVVDGGDQAAAVVTLLLLPLTLTDPRKWHWTEHVTDNPSREAVPRIIAASSLCAIKVQVAGIYFHAAVGKFFVPEWADGTAVYYYFTDPMMGIPPWQLRFMQPLLQSAWVVLPTWGTLVLELFLVFALFLPMAWKRAAFGLGVAFHALIALMLGLVSFALTMISALILYLRHDSVRITTIVRGASVTFGRCRVINVGQAVVGTAAARRRRGA